MGRWERVLEGYPFLVPGVIAAGLSVAALAEWPYGFYVFLRWVICAAGIYAVVAAIRYKRVWAAWIYGCFAVLFNPVIPVHLTREIWRPIDVLTAVAFVGAVLVLRPRVE